MVVLEPLVDALDNFPGKVCGYLSLFLGFVSGCFKLSCECVYIHRLALYAGSLPVANVKSSFLRLRAK